MRSIRLELFIDGEKLITEKVSQERYAMRCEILQRIGFWSRKPWQLFAVVGSKGNLGAPAPIKRDKYGRVIGKRGKGISPEISELIRNDKADFKAIAVKYNICLNTVYRHKFNRR